MALLGDVDAELFGQRRFADRRTCSEDHLAAGLDAAAQQAVEHGDARGDAGLGLAVGHGLDAVEHPGHKNLNGLGRAFGAGGLERFELGLRHADAVEDGAMLAGQIDHFTGGAGEAAGQRLVGDELGVAAHRARRACGVGEFVEPHQADALGAALLLQQVEHGDDVGLLAGVDELAGGAEHAADGLVVEVLRGEQVGHLVDEVVVGEQGTDEAGFGFLRPGQGVQQVLLRRVVWQAGEGRQGAHA